MARMQVIEINSFDSLLSLASVWNKLLSNCEDNNVFLTHEWITTWWKHFGRDKRLLVLVIKDGGREIGIAPLMYSRLRYFGASIGKIEFVGAGRTIYHNFIIVKRKYDCLKAILDYLEKHPIKWDFLELQQLPDTSNTMDLITDITNEHNYKMEKKRVKRCPCLLINGSWETYYNHLPRKTRKELRRVQNRLSEKHTVEFVVVRQGEIEKNMNTLFYLTQQRHKTFSSPVFRNFHIDIAQRFSRNGWLNLSFITANEKPISALYGYEYNKEFYAYSSGFDPTYSKYTLGHLHFKYIIKYCFDNNIKKFDFLWGSQEYKRRWSTLWINNFRLRLVRDKVYSKIKYFIGKKFYRTAKRFQFLR